MTSRCIMLATLLALAACGVDGPPQRPAGGTAAEVTVTGEVAAGLRMDAG